VAASVSQRALTMSGYPNPGAPSVVKVLSNGNAPRRDLRFAVAVPYNEEIDMEIDMSISIEQAGQEVGQMRLPHLIMTSEMGVTDIAANGDMSIASALKGVATAPGASRSVAASIQRLNDQMKMVTMTGIMTPAGITRGLTVDLGAM